MKGSLTNTQECFVSSYAVDTVVFDLTAAHWLDMKQEKLSEVFETRLLFIILIKAERRATLQT